MTGIAMDDVKQTCDSLIRMWGSSLMMTSRISREATVRARTHSRADILTNPKHRQFITLNCQWKHNGFKGEVFTCWRIQKLSATHYFTFWFPSRISSQPPGSGEAMLHTSQPCAAQTTRPYSPNVCPQKCSLLVPCTREVVRQLGWISAPTHTTKRRTNYKTHPSFFTISQIQTSPTMRLFLCENVFFYVATCLLLER